MALLVLFVPGDEPDRLGFVQSSFLGIVSWQFILVSSTPVTGYNTKLDNFMLISMVTVFVAYFWNSIRIGFFDWVSKKHDVLYATSEGDAVAPSEAPVLFVRSTSSETVPPQPSDNASTKKHERFLLCSNFCKLFRKLCRKCGEDDLHWTADTSVGVFLCSVFIVACASLMANKTTGA